MVKKAKYTVVDGIRCYSPEVADACADFPEDGFNLTDGDESEFFWSRSRNRLFRRIIGGNLSSSGKTRYLEIGCATGEFIRHIADNPKLEITGSEVTLKALQCAKRNLPAVEFVQLDVTREVIGEGVFDLVAAFDVIEHIENDGAAISNISRMIRPGGRFIVSVPQHMFMWSRMDDILKHKRRYSRKELVTRLQDGGFEVMYATSFLFVLFPLMLIRRLFDRGGGRSRPGQADGALKKRIRFPDVLNRVFDLFMRIDELLIRMGLSLPFGGTLVVVARKR